MKMSLNLIKVLRLSLTKIVYVPDTKRTVAAVLSYRHRFLHSVITRHTYLGIYSLLHIASCTVSSLATLIWEYTRYYTSLLAQCHHSPHLSGNILVITHRFLHSVITRHTYLGIYSLLHIASCTVSSLATLIWEYTRYYTSLLALCHHSPHLSGSKLVITHRFLHSVITRHTYLGVNSLLHIASCTVSSLATLIWEYTRYYTSLLAQCHHSPHLSGNILVITHRFLHCVITRHTYLGVYSLLHIASCTVSSLATLIWEYTRYYTSLLALCHHSPHLSGSKLVITHRYLHCVITRHTYLGINSLLHINFQTGICGKELWSYFIVRNAWHKKYNIATS